MKRFITGLLVAILTLPVAATAQLPTYELCIDNQHVVGNQFVFDITLLNTSIYDINLGSTDFFFNYKPNFFCGRTTAVVVLDDALRQYDYQIDIPDVGGLWNGIMGFALIVPNVTGDIEGRVLRIGPSESVRICQIIVSTVCANSGEPELAWRVGTGFGTILHSFAETPPWPEILISEGTAFCVNDGHVGPGEPADQLQVTVNPNPIDDVFSLHLENEAFLEVDVRIFDMGGKVVASFPNQVTNGEGTTGEMIIMGEIAKGTYIIYVSEKSGARTGSVKCSIGN